MPDRAQGECKHFHNTGDKIRKSQKCHSILCECNNTLTV
jgi:hypothetical protein